MFSQTSGSAPSEAASSGEIEPASTSEILDSLIQCGDPLFVVDEHYRIVAWNSAAQALLGFGPDQTVGQPCYRLLNGTDLHGQRVCAAPCAPMLALQRGQPPPSFTIQVDEGSGARRPVEMSLVPLPRGLTAHVLRDASRHLSHERFVGQIRHALDRLVGETAPPDEEIRVTTAALTTREQEILRLLAQGASTNEIASQLVLSSGTVRTHVQHILAKLGARRRLEAVAIARRRGLLS